MAATSKGYSAEDEADAANGMFADQEGHAIARFLAQTDHLLAVVIAALVVCVGFIAVG
jgi:hypothetical protein